MSPEPVENTRACAVFFHGPVHGLTVARPLVKELRRGGPQAAYLLGHFFNLGGTIISIGVYDYQLFDNVIIIMLIDARSCGTLTLSNY